MVSLKDLKLEHLEKDTIYLKYLEALNIFLEKYLPNIPHTHVFLTGSFVEGRLKAGSDLDIDIIHSETKEQKVRQIVINEIEVEYATFSFDMINQWLDEGYDKPKLLANAVSHWKMIIGKDFPTKLVEKAKKIK